MKNSVHETVKKINFANKIALPSKLIAIFFLALSQKSISSDRYFELELKLEKTYKNQVRKRKSARQKFGPQTW